MSLSLEGNLKRVIQENENGCGIACVAMLADLRYWEARNKVFGSADKANHITKVHDIRKGLRKCGLILDRRRAAREWKKETARVFKALLEIKPHKTSNYWHWVVWDGHRVLDPSPNSDRYKRPLQYCRSFFEVRKARA